MSTTTTYSVTGHDLRALRRRRERGGVGARGRPVAWRSTSSPAACPVSASSARRRWRTTQLRRRWTKPATTPWSAHDRSRHPASGLTGSGQAPVAVAQGVVDLDIAGMTCASCAARIEKKLNKLDGVEASVNYATEKATRPLRPDAGHHRRPAGDRRGHRLRRDAPGATAGRTTGRHGHRPATAHGPRDGTRHGWPAAPAAAGLGRARRAGAAAVDGARRCSSTTGSGWRCPRRRRSSSGARGRSTARPWLNARHGAATMDTLVSIGIAGRLRLVAVGAVPRRRRDARHAHVVRPAARRADAGDRRALPRGRRRRHRLPARRALRRGPRQAPLRRRAAGAARARRQGRRRAAATAPSVRRARSAGSWSATGSSCGRARRSPPTASSSTAPPPWTRRMLTGEPVPVEVGPGDAVIGATVNAGGRLVVRATRVGADTPLAPDRPAGRARRRPARRRCSGWPTGSPAVFVPVVLVARRRAPWSVWLRHRATGRPPRSPPPSPS